MRHCQSDLDTAVRYSHDSSCLPLTTVSCQIITQHALDAFDNLLSSPSGWKCLKVCLMYATSGRLRDLEENIVLQTSVIAKDQHR